MSFDPDGPAIEKFAFMAGATVDDCVRHGATWTLERALERRSWIQVILIARQLTGAGIAYGKRLVGGATVERVKALGETIDRADTESVVVVLDEWMPGEHANNERLARGLLRAFGREGP